MKKTFVLLGLAALLAGPAAAGLDPFTKTEKMFKAKPASTRLKIRQLGAVRLCVNRTPRHIYAQVIDDAAGRTVASASTLEKDVRGQTGATVAALAGWKKAKPNSMVSQRVPNISATSPEVRT